MVAAQGLLGGRHYGAAGAASGGADDEDLFKMKNCL
jgi:hypothetical protein